MGEALSGYPLPTPAASVTQRVIFAEAAARGQAVRELEHNGPAATEIAAVAAELLEQAP